MPGRGDHDCADADLQVAPVVQQDNSPAGPADERHKRSQHRRDRLDEAFYRLRMVLPPRLRPALRWLRSGRSRFVRIPLGLLCIAASFFWFMPVVGLEWFPLGLLLLAQDVPFLRRPAAAMTLWAVRCIEWMQDRWRRWRRWRKKEDP